MNIKGIQGLFPNIYSPKRSKKEQAELRTDVELSDSQLSARHGQGGAKRKEAAKLRKKKQEEAA